MTSDPFARSRLRKVLVAVILATIPMLLCRVGGNTPGSRRS